MQNTHDVRIQARESNVEKRANRHKDTRNDQALVCAGPRRLEANKGVAKGIDAIGVPADRLLGVDLKVAGITRALDARLVRRDGVLRVVLLPVDACKVRMALDVVGAGKHVAQAAGEVNLQQPVDQRLQLWLKLLGHGQVTARDLLEHVHLALGLKRRVAAPHLKHKHTNGPPVDGVSIALVDDDLRGKILRGAAHGVGAVVDALGKAKVGEANVSAVVNEHVLGLEVAEHNVDVVQKVKRKNGLRCEKLGLLLGKTPPLLLLDDGEHLAAVDKLQDKVQAASVLKIVVHAHDEFAIDAEKDVLFIDCVLHLSGLNHAVFGNNLDGAKLGRTTLLCEQNTAKRPSPQCTVNDIILERLLGLVAGGDLLELGLKRFALLELGRILGDAPVRLDGQVSLHLHARRCRSTCSCIFLFGLGLLLLLLLLLFAQPKHESRLFFFY
eukprot:m.225942 g.225942  ORF g.225942 m.225942 type:complete len:440 (-) comp16834_c0_seq1:103-1422(-)